MSSKQRNSLPSWGNELWLTRGQRRFIGTVTTVTVVVGLVGWLLSLTPGPSAMAIRSLFERGGAETAAEMQKHVPDVPLDVLLDQHVGGDEDDSTAGDPSRYDVFSPADGDEPLPTIVWVHGGAWISGSSTDVDPYLRILAAEGYTTVGLNYSLGPEETYPTAVHQLNDALLELEARADDLRIDRDRIVLAGDSAGAQLASQLAALTTNPRYAQLLGIDPALDASQLVGVVLNCGVYDLDAMSELTGLPAWGFRVALWAYTGKKDWSQGAAGSTMSTIDFVTEEFPPTYISGGNADGLTWLQSLPMRDRLVDQGVDVTELFWPADHEPALGHEYQFHLDGEDAQAALVETLEFLQGVTR
ncbi:alpha/beta hydrolase [Agromyces endophyticus]|uniref:alpha/beta hydrolase n=1 Tax=Agromyces sp. H17E-10 TaxID=2932244 RepID=UPI001FD0F775|nr:alpha/beta hydrolase [Agromyces sp. H17E-10]UOQ90489.1 alpha/beta hydrolase [Agromyces sp. H17E-10]